MANRALESFLGNLRRSLLRRDRAGLADAALLELYVTRKDDAAFEALMRRHSPMVIGVCRRILQNEADTEDAFQATFLVFLRKAGSIRPRERVGNWLHGVARTTALKARATNKRRRSHEAVAANTRLGSAQGLDDREHLREILDREVAALPEKYRAVIIACDLEGKSIKQAARQLACPQGTVGTRLARGRVLLGRRLARHGLGMVGGSMGCAMAQSAHAVPTLLLTKTVNVIFGAKNLPNEVMSAQVAALTQGVLKTMILNKVKTITAAAIFMALFGAGLSVLGYRAVAAMRPQENRIGNIQHVKQPRAVQAAAQPDEPAWKKEFRAKYGLKDGEHLKRIAPPYPACRLDYLNDAFSPNQGLPWERQFVAWGWKDNWIAPRHVVRSAPVEAEEGITLINLLDNLLARVGLLPRIDGAADILDHKVTGDFVYRVGATPEQVANNLQTILNRDCNLAVSLRFKEDNEWVFVLSGKYEPKPLKGKKKDELEVYAEHFTDNPLDRRGSCGFDSFLMVLERHIKQPVIADKITGEPNFMHWHLNVRSPIVNDNGVDSYAEDTNPHAVIRNIAAQTGLTVKLEERKVRRLIVE